MINKRTLIRKFFLFLFIDFILIIALVYYFGFYRNTANIQIHGVYLPHALALNDFKLIDTQQQLLTQKRLIGHWSLLYFGFTSCQSICPTTLSQLNKLYQQIPTTKRPMVIFISVDPKNDTINKIKTFVHAFNPAFIGARTNIDEVLHLQKILHLNTNSQNPLNHSMDLVLINPQGQIQAYFSYPQTVEHMLEDYLSILKFYKRESNVKTFPGFDVAK
ncbi:SCO1/SenC family transporter protein [Legionella santicrucis]|uniref:SCO1/SenC family transporter protein n=1 Tax=Legionella santicrucis TaxID=45074 RepID=A0A0W0Z3M7_9GAMM|nr:SCO family protein [Legionella santicrucis]KTD63738.1 SCO1/SenC family transporter protein [Legionella santicrucis]